MIEESRDIDTQKPFHIFDRRSTDVDIRGLFLMFWRRKIVIVGVLLIAISMAMIAMTFVQPRYTARSLVLIKADMNQYPMEGLEFLGVGMRLDTSLVYNEIEVLRSRTLARKVVERLNLMSDPEFNARFRREAQEEAGSHTSFKKLSVYGSELQTLPPEVVDSDIAEVVTRFLKGLSVRPVSGSFAIQVEYTSFDAAKAALITNTVVDVYIEQRLDDKFKAAKKVTDWLDKRLTDLREQVRLAEEAVEAYRAQENLVEGTKTVVSAEQLSELNSQLVQAKTQLAEAEARLAQVDDLVLNVDSIETVSEVIDSELIRQLKFAKVQLEGEITEFSTRYGEKHPEMIKRRMELVDLGKTIHSEMLKISQALEGQVRFAEARVRALEEGLFEITGQRNVDNEAMIRLRELEREAASTRLIFDTFLQTYKRSDEQEELQESEVQVVSYAIVPRVAAFPNEPLILSLSGVVALFFGLGLALLIEKLDNTYRSASQLEASLNFPCYALIPAVENMSQPDLSQYIISKPSSTVAEAVRTLRMVLNLRPPKSGEKPRVVTITSSFPGEGKTMLSVWLARLTAKSGEKVIVVDADLRRPNVHRAMGLNNDVTLVEYLTEQKELDEVIQKDEASGAHMIYGRSVPNSALDLISSGNMERLVHSLRQVYDLVIIDSPACLAVSDARVLAKMSDQTLYGVAWDQTPREVVMSGVKQFSDMGYESLSFVLTNVDVKRHVRYGYGDTIYYYGRYKEYYSD